MQAIILAAGMGRRLGNLTANNTKCMVKVNGICLIDRMLTQLCNAGIKKIILVVGYKREVLCNYIHEHYSNTDLNITFITNDIYDKTNNIYSLWLAKDYLTSDDTILLESDLIFEESVLQLAIDSKFQDCALVSKYESWMDGTMVRIDEEHNIINFIPKKAFKFDDADLYYKTVNIYKFSKDFSSNHYIPFLDAYMRVLGNNEYYEQVLRVITLIDGCNLKAIPVEGRKWYEIDDIQDLNIAETIFASPQERIEKIERSYGGYWRYPSLIDFCYLVNPYFPKAKMIDEIKANFELLLRSYPSGLRINSMLGAKYFNINPDYVCVGNGAAEIIEKFMSNLSGTVGVVLPTFEEYKNRIEKDNIIAFIPSNKEFSYTSQDLIDFFNDKDIDSLILINPDNPSGNFIPTYSLFKIIDWAKHKSIKLIIDESFVDFTDNFIENSLLKNEILEGNPNLIVIKSISKSYGVPGLRLGILATSDKDTINDLRQKLPIWNINSFAEFYMQIYGKYEKDYRKSCIKFIEERVRFKTLLDSVKYLRVIPSQANYFLCEIVNQYTANDLQRLLMDKFNILIKNCTAKAGFEEKGQYIRIAIRDQKDNDFLIKSLKYLENK